LRYVRGFSGRAVLARNKQPLAAMQLQGRLLDAWTEVVYDGQGYRLSSERDRPDHFSLIDQAGEQVGYAEGGAGPQLVLSRALPLPLLVMVAAAILDKAAPGAESRTSDPLSRAPSVS